MRHLIVANMLAGILLALLLLPGVLEPLGAAGERTAEIQDLRDYNGALSERNRTLRESLGKAVCSPDGGYDVPRSDVPPLSPGDVEERLQREGAASGAVEVTLAWNGRADLDLSVICPGGEAIRFDSKSGCGGRLDVDMNNGANVSDQPVEHVTWPENAAPPGLYKVNVTYFKDYSGTQPTVPFSVDIKVGGQSRRLSQTISFGVPTTFVDSFMIGAAAPQDPAPSVPQPAPQPGPQPTPAPEAGPQSGPAPEPDILPLPKDPERTVVEQGGSAVPLTEAIEKGVVFILASNPANQTLSSGSGFLIGDRRVVTNRHVIEGATSILVVSQILGQPREARVAAQTPNSEHGQPDFAVLETEAPLAPATALSITPVAERLEQVVSAGFPGFLLDSDEGFRRLSQGDLSAAPEIVTTEGIIARPARPTDAVPLLMHSADIAQGNSGGPLLDLCGRVVGVNTLVRPGSENNYHTSWALGASGLQKFLESNGISATVEDGACSPNAQPDAAPTQREGG